ncbi:hypothetical protein [Agrobacterium tumefaciens]|uniref:hypothetical protein n=1 Tax=Agrobacterium tumefaciens TaxID=358 RepID=UPI00045BA26D|nr:hypothetical protein [Agrobacterium tumefaciens]CDN93501.1 hypothetical protein BN949_02655 [Agrobacterium tumefaciens]
MNSRTFEPDQLLTALIDAFLKDGHFVHAKAGKMFVLVVTEEDDESQSSEFCLSDIAAYAAERMSK